MGTGSGPSSEEYVASIGDDRLVIGMLVGAGFTSRLIR